MPAPTNPNGGNMKPGIMNLKKWAAKTASLVERICLRKGEDGAIPLGISLLFFNPTAPEEEQWNFVIELAADPNTPMPEEERKRLAACFEYIMIGVRKIYEDGVPEDDAPATRGSFH
jgi:hypothetical protein